MKATILLICMSLSGAVSGQSTLPVIKAKSVQVAINDGGFLDKNAWTLSPKARPDVYTADRSRQTKRVTFYTDIDSISIILKPGTSVDFIILLNGKDSCYTRISSAIPASVKTTGPKNTHDTIPFILTAYNSIAVKATINNRDTVNLHFDTGSFDFRLTKDGIRTKTNLLANQPDAIAGKTAPNYSKLVKISTIQLGKLLFENPTVVVTGLTAHEMDGRFGWNLFEGKIIEIDYDKQLLIIHEKLPRRLKSYTKSALKFIRSCVCITGDLHIGNKIYTGDFLLDSGSDMALILDSLWAVNQHFPTDLPLIRVKKFSDPRGVSYETKMVQLPLIRLNGFDLINVPMAMLGSKNPTGFSINFLGNDLLKRFNTILDFKNDCIYLKPNKLTNLGYKEIS